MASSDGLTSASTGSCRACGHAAVGLRRSKIAVFVERVTPGRRSWTTCASFEYSETASMTRTFCPCSGPAHQLRVVDRADGIELNGSGW